MLALSQVFRTFLTMRLVALYNFERYYSANKVNYVHDLVFNTNEAQRT